MDGGTGLRGLAQRVDSVDGALRLSSPLGGPTTIEVELPCE
jgi:signal transduction histidine kinase